MRTGFFILLLALPALAWSGDNDRPESGEETDTVRAGTAQPTDDSSVTWVDDSHAYTTDRVQDMTEWMDSFFGDPVYDLEKPDSLLRLTWKNSWDEQDDHKSRLKLRGKLRLPNLSSRLSLVFSGEEGDDLVPGATREDADTADLVYNVREKKRSRVDLTLGLNQDGLKPGVRYRHQAPISEDWGYRFTQRLQWESDEGVYTTGQFNLDHVLTDNQLVRWSTRGKYGEETEGVEWRSILSLNQRFESAFNHDPSVLSFFTSVHGVTDPEYIENVRIGTVLRQQLFRRYFFFEVEPSYNFRKRRSDEDRDGAWNIILRLEILFEPRRRRSAGNSDDDPSDSPNIDTERPAEKPDAPYP